MLESLSAQGVGVQAETASEHALQVAREAVRAGLADRETALRLYREYTHYVRANQEVRGSFTQLLLSRGVIDQGGFDLLEEVAPTRPASASGLVRSGDSGEFQTLAPAAQGTPPQGTPPPPPPDASRHDPEDRGSARHDSPGGERLDSAPREGGDPDGAAPAAPTAVAGSAPELTLDFDQVLPPPQPARAASGEYQAQAVSAFDSTATEERPPGFPLPEQSSDIDLIADDLGAQEQAFFASDSEPLPGQDDQQTFREPQVGEVMGDYQLEKVLGRGGMGVIYLAKKAGTEERYALKALAVPHGSLGVKRRQRFQREVEALRRLQHPNIIRVHTCGRKGGYDWYVMDFVQGKELKELLRDGKLTNNEKLEIFLDICKAVHHAHERNIIHRDLKPANVLIGDDDGHVFVLDFGLAKIQDDLGQEAITKTGAALGTPYYMAPEQLLNPRDVDPRSDVFGLGVVLYEMLVGERPFRGETAGEVSNRVLNETPLRPSKANPNLHPSVDAVIMKALEKDPALRHPDVDALRRDVQRYRRGTVIKRATSVDALLGDARRYAQQHWAPLAIGFVLATLFWVPVMFVFGALFL